MTQILVARPASRRPSQTQISDPPTRLRDLIPAVAFGIAGLFVIGLATLSGPGAGDQVLVIGPPALDREGVVDIVLRAEGAVVDVGRLPNVVIAVADRPDFTRALREHGAWLAVPAPQPFGCITEQEAGR